MGLSLCLFNAPIRMLSVPVIVLLFHSVVANSLQQPSCLDEESSALLQFKDSFIIKESASSSAGAYPKASSWKRSEGGNSSCCSWDGVECDEKTGHVIGLDLSSSCLFGSINSSSTLFSLAHLQRLNLSYNNFNYSQIPSSIRDLPSLTHLDLSASFFSGQVPPEISHLSKLTYLDLCCNANTSLADYQGLLKLNGSIFRSLVQNLTSLQTLSLSYINISSNVPESLSNLTSLTSLSLKECELFGEFQARVFKLPNLKILSIRFNQDLTGHLPEFNQTSPLTLLKLSSTSFSGNLPSSFQNLESLEDLDVSKSNFSQGLVPSSLGNLRNLMYLDLSANRFTGGIPDSFANLTQLSLLRIASCRLSGPTPSWLGNLTSLSHLNLAYNGLTGSIPVSFSNLINLEALYLHNNNLGGIVEFHNLFQNLQNLNQLHLSGNNLELLMESTTANASFPQFEILGLGSCNIKEFPSFLTSQNNLERLDLARNKVHGQVPKWFWNTSTKSLTYIDISENFISGLHQPPSVLPWSNLQFIGLASNTLSGQLPIPPPTTLGFEVQNNQFSGELSPMICTLSSLRALDLSDNNFSGMIPQCLGNFSDDLVVLLLANNSFHGSLPQTFSNRSNLRMIDVSHNQFQGKLPPSLANCLMLESLLLSSNQFNDGFPFWLRAVPELRVLAMRHNAFHGLIEKPEYNNHGFPKLRVLDLSYNNFSGEFVSNYIFSDYAMRSNITVNQSTYLLTNIEYGGGGVYSHDYDYSITITNKGVDIYYSRIQEAFAAIDISSNKFQGKIDELIGNLRGLRSLNVSNNVLIGSIPSSLGNLTELESLDLSQNKLSGQIPQQLSELTFLSEFNVSHNNLIGLIPHRRQFTTFDSTSYEGNPGLCGEPLVKKCGDSEVFGVLSPSGVEDDDSGSGGVSEFDWMVVLAGVGSGLVMGIVLCDVVITRKHERFNKIVRMIRPRLRKM